MAHKPKPIRKTEKNIIIELLNLLNPPIPLLESDEEKVRKLCSKLGIKASINHTFYLSFDDSPESPR